MGQHWGHMAACGNPLRDPPPPHGHPDPPLLWGAEGGPVNPPSPPNKANTAALLPPNAAAAGGRGLGRGRGLMCTIGAGPDAAALYGDGLHGDGGVATSVPIHEFPHCAVPIGSTAGRGVACGRRSFYISPFLIRRQEGASPPLLLSDWLRGLGGGEAGPTRLLRLAERLVGVPWAEGQEELEARFLIGWGGGGERRWDFGDSRLAAEVGVGSAHVTLPRRCLAGSGGHVAVRSGSIT